MKESEDKEEEIAREFAREKPNPYLTERQFKKFKFIITTDEWGESLLRKINAHHLYLVRSGKACIIRLSDLRSLRSCYINGKWVVDWYEMEEDYYV